MRAMSVKVAKRASSPCGQRWREVRRRACSPCVPCNFDTRLASKLAKGARRHLHIFVQHDALSTHNAHIGLWLRLASTLATWVASHLHRRANSWHIPNYPPAKKKLDKKMAYALNACRGAVHTRMTCSWRASSRSLPARITRRESLPMFLARLRRVHFHATCDLR